MNFRVDSLLRDRYVAESTSAEATERVSLLALAWDRKVQVAKLVKSELKVYGKWSIDSAAVGVAWLDDQVSLLFFFLVFSHVHVKLLASLYNLCFWHSSYGGGFMKIYC